MDKAAQKIILLHSKQKFKELVKVKVRNAAFKYLKELQEKHSKEQSISYTKMKMQEYLSSPMLDNESRSLLLRLRIQTVSGMKWTLRGYIQTLPAQ